MKIENKKVQLCKTPSKINLRRGKKLKKSFFSCFLHFFHHSKTALMKSASRRNGEVLTGTRPEIEVAKSTKC